MTPPDYLSLNDEGRAAWCRVHARMVSRGEWRREYSMHLGLLASQAQAYLSLAREIRALRDAGCDCLAELEIGLAETHRLARTLMFDFGLIPEGRERIAPVDDEGLDAEITNLCRSLELQWTVMQ